MWTQRPIEWTLAMLALATATTGCDPICAGGSASCKMSSPCQTLTYTCAADTLELRTLGNETDARGGWDALAGSGDVLLGNGQVVAVIAGIGDQNYLDPNGGSILDLSNRGKGNDGINQVLQVVGILPDDSVSYTSLQLIDERPVRVAVLARGTLLHRPSVPVLTLYELRPCDPGVRVRTEVLNGTPDQALWALSDGYYWSLREALPFTPGAGLGFEHAPFGLTTINDAYLLFPFMAASTHVDPPASYAVVGCKQDALEGFQSEQVSSLGIPRRVVPPREYVTYERMLFVAPRGDVAAAADLAIAARQKLYGDAFVTVHGKVLLGGAPAKGEREVSLLLAEGAARTTRAARVPWSQATADATGAFTARVPAHRSYVVEVHSFGHKMKDIELGRLDGDRDLGTIDLGARAAVTLDVVDEGGKRLDAVIFVVPADAATESASSGSFHGQFGSCSPWLGAPPGSSPACNRVLVAAAGNAPAPVEMLPGNYHFYAYHGPFYTIARHTVNVTAGGAPPALHFMLRSLGLLPQGALSSDLHVHGAASFDSSIPDPDRVLSFAAANVDVIIATDHDVVYDYAPVVTALGLAAHMSTVAGVETTGHVPFLQVPGDPFPRVIGHYNFWPLAYRPGLPRNGGPFDEFVEPGALFDAVDPLFQGTHIIQLNHPWADSQFGRDLGFPRALGLNLLQDLPAADEGTNQGMYIRTPRGGGHANNSHTTQEVMNGTINDVLLPYRAFWFYTLNQGQIRTGTANSDSHGLTDNVIGSPRTIVYSPTRAGPGFDVERFNQSLLEGTAFGTNGPIIEATIVDGAGKAELGYGTRVFAPPAGAQLKLLVSAAPWVPVEEIRIVVNGKVVKTLDGLALAPAPDPFGVDGTVRFLGMLPLDSLLPPSGDAWLVVEAGSHLPLAADLGGGAVSDRQPHGAPDGVPDTTDNNGDGKVDFSDVAPGSKVGPLNNPAPPKDESDPRYHFAQVVPGGYPMAFTNPFVLDQNGNGRFDPPLVKGGQ